MKIFLLGLALTLVAAASAAGAITARTYYLTVGDTAVAAGDWQCKAVAPLSLRCFQGGDYRGKYGVILSSHSVQITQYQSYSRYRVILKKRQTPVG